VGRKFYCAAALPKEMPAPRKTLNSREWKKNKKRFHTILIFYIKINIGNNVILYNIIHIIHRVLTPADIGRRSAVYAYIAVSSDIPCILLYLDTL